MAERGSLAALAITHAAAAGLSADALAPVLERAERAAAGSPHLWALRAELSDDASQAAELWTRAADAVEDPSLAARWLCSAALRLRALRGPEAALPLSRRAREAAPQDVPALVLLAELLESAGREEALVEAFSQLLDLEPPDDDTEEIWERALARAATFHVRRGEEDRARPFLAAMEDRVPFPTDPGILEAPDAGSSELFEDPPSGEIELDRALDGEASDAFDHDAESDLDWPKSEVWEAPPKDLADEEEAAFDEEWSPSEVWDAEPRLADRGEDGADGEGPESGTHQAPPRPSEAPRAERSSDVAPASEAARAASEAPMVTQVAVTDDELRALLEEVGASEDPIALLEGAMEGAFDDGDPDAVRRVLTVLDRATTLPGAEGLSALRKRALAWLAER